jgi:hypothetical protein
MEWPSFTGPGAGADRGHALSLGLRAMVAATSSRSRYKPPGRLRSVGGTAISAGGRVKMNQPPSASTDRVPSTLPYGRPGPLGVGAVEDGVGTVDHGGILSLAGTGVRNVEGVDGLLQCLVSTGGWQHVQYRSVECRKRAFPWTSTERFPLASTIGRDLGERRVAQRFPGFC